MWNFYICWKYFVFLSWKSCNILSWRHCCDVMVLYLMPHKTLRIFIVANPETTSSGHPHHLMPGPVKIPKISRPRHPDAIGRMIETFLKLGKNRKTLSLRVFIFSNQWITVINQSGISPRSLTVRLWKIPGRNSLSSLPTHLFSGASY